MNEAVPPLSVPLPITVVPSRKSTVPVALLGATVAVNVTDWPKLDGFCDESTVVVVAGVEVGVAVAVAVAVGLGVGVGAPIGVKARSLQEPTPVAPTAVITPVAGLIVQIRSPPRPPGRVP